MVLSKDWAPNGDFDIPVGEDQYLILNGKEVVYCTYEEHKKWHLDFPNSFVVAKTMGEKNGACYKISTVLLPYEHDGCPFETIIFDPEVAYVKRHKTYEEAKKSHDTVVKSFLNKVVLENYHLKGIEE